MRSRIVRPSLLLAAALAACGENSTDPSPKPKPVASLSVLPGALSLTVGQTGNLTAVARDAAGATLSGRTITWSTADAAIATVSSAGVVSAVAAGTAEITATSEGKSGSAVVTVTPIPVATVTVTPRTATVMVGGDIQLSAATLDASGNALGRRMVSWASSNPAVATVSHTGLASAVAPGAATITARSEEKTGSATLTIVPVPVASVTVAPIALDLIVGQDGNLTATAKDTAGNTLGGRTFAWASDNIGVASVSDSGVVTAVAPGTTAIRATSEGKSGAASVTVLPVPVASVLVTPDAASVDAGATLTLTATPKDAGGNTLGGRSVSWTSSDLAIAVVSQSGVVTAMAPGTATITASAGGRSGRATITVTPAPVATVDVRPGTATMMVGQALPFVATLRDARGTPLTNRTITWASSNNGVATVSATGIGTSIGAGTATITATSEGVSGRATIAVPGSFSIQAALSNQLVVEGSPITYRVDFGFGFSAISEVQFSFVFGEDALDPGECLEWRGGFCNPNPAPQTSRMLTIPCVGDPETCGLFRDGVDTRQITASRFSGSGAVSVRIASLVITVIGTPLPPQ